MNHAVVVGLVFSCIVALSYAADFQNCGKDDYGKFSSISVDGCKPEHKYCLLKKGKNATISIDFVATKIANKVEALVWGRIGELDVPFPLPNADGCRSGVQCPVQPNTQNHYAATLFVEKYYPKIQLLVKWELVNEKNDVIVCALIPAQIR